MIRLLLDNPLLLLFVVAAIGYPLGRLKLWGSSLGVAGVLFAGLGIGALHPDLKLPEVVYMLGLSVFVYTVGLSSGPGFFSSFRRKGLRDNILVLSIVLLGAILVLGAWRLLHLRPALAAGLFTGSMTCTPALAGQLDFLKRWAPLGARDPMLSDPVVAYSIAYPMGVLGVILAVNVLRRLWRVDLAVEHEHLRGLGAHDRLVSRTVLITRPVHSGETMGALIRRHRWDVVFGRVDHDGRLSVITADTVIGIGDRMSVVGAEGEVERVISHLGTQSIKEIDLDRREVDYRRVFVSNPQIAGRRIRDLKVIQRYGAIVTRIKRGDDEFLPHPDTVLELGDRVRILAAPERLQEVADFFGDSFRALSEIDVLTFSLGLACGLLVGIIPIPLPGNVVFTLGFAGGPLVVGLVLGWLSRTGPMVWTLPYNANLTLRQIALILFLAGVGTRAGYSFVTTLTQGGGLAVFLAGAAITFAVATATLWIGYRLLKIPMTLMLGVLAGVQTQSAVLGFALEQTGNDLPTLGYSTAYPVATVAKILVGQMILSIMLGH
jgi:putative transport protein